MELGLRTGTYLGRPVPLLPELWGESFDTHGTDAGDPRTGCEAPGSRLKGNLATGAEEGVKIETQIWTQRVEENIALEVKAEGHFLLSSPGASVHSPDPSPLGLLALLLAPQEKGELVGALWLWLVCVAFRLLTVGLSS